MGCRMIMRRVVCAAPCAAAAAAAAAAAFRPRLGPPRLPSPAPTPTPPHCLPTWPCRVKNSLIKEFERDARAAGLEPRDLAERKRALVTELNSLIALRKGYAAADEARGELLAGAAVGGGGGAAAAGAQQQQNGTGGDPYDGVSTQELIKQGRRGMQESAATLGRAEKLVEDTLQIGQQVRCGAVGGAVCSVCVGACVVRRCVRSASVCLRGGPVPASRLAAPRGARGAPPRLARGAQ